MTPERWQRVKEIFQTALDRAPGERSAFLAQACGGDEALRKEVESLIASHEKSGTFIDAPAYEAAADAIVHEKGDLRSGDTIGSYEILSFLSRGGMGEVYLAQDRRLGRRVALKILPVSFTKDVDRLGRFEQEARAASALNHPNMLAFGRRQGFGGSIVTMPSAGGEMTSVTKDQGRQNGWSPDGDKIVFAAFRGGVWNIYWVSRSTRQEKQLTHYTKQSVFVAYPEWSPRGDQIVYEYAETAGNIWLMELK